ncbi:LPP20 family lipoprotein [Aurantibacillus circumpalustris]|uniref:LPP20 family lipoprotein n=1 Tax=Aurantibacillus circumpalustris TaxID=3036359 RepID=UPI00295B98F5|nr:LPP20 family lipoprotein [Aurantibacillus circumpalustris]
MRNIFYIVIAVIFLASCKAKQVVLPDPVAEQVKAPNWVSSRPNNGFKYIGVGFSEKSKGENYQIEAKKNALYDLASEIKVDISSNSVLYTVQNNNKFNENFNSLIKLSNSDNIEGYSLVDSYENDKQYWVYYQLDKKEYADLKARKKQLVIDKASNLIAASFYDEKNKDFSSSLKKRIQSFGVLTPYLSEEINFDPQQTNGIKNVFDLTNLIQTQLQSINVVPQIKSPVLKPYQATYSPLLYNLELKSKTPLQNFPLMVASDEGEIMVNERTSTNGNGEVQIKVNSVEPLNQNVAFSLSPDINTLMASDSVSNAGIKLLKQFIQTPALKVSANVTNITIHVNSIENNFGKQTGLHSVETYIKQKFNGQEIRLVDIPEEADYIIESIAETKEDISSAILSANYNIKLAALIIDLQLKNRITNEVLFKTQVNDVYGYANSLDNAGLNAYSNPKINAKLAESLFFLKRKILVY